MNTFIFQSVSDRFDLRSELHVGETVTWYATRYQRLMDIGDFVYFWMAGGPEIRGIYGWGKILSKPYLKPDWDSHGVDVSCEYYFAKPVLAVDIESQTALKDMLIFRVRVGTNFRLDEKEAQVLSALISQKGQTAPRLT